MTPSIESLNIMVTNQCPLQCEHCGPRSGPWAKGAIDLDSVIAALDEAKARSCKIVNFTGGEPFIIGHKLVDMIEAASQRRLTTRITTGAYWSATADAAAKRLEPLAQAGLRQLFISSSDQHRAFVPLSNIVEAGHAAMNRGIEVYVTVGISKGGATSARVVREAFEAAGAAIPWLTESPLIPFGRAEEALHRNELLLQPVENFAGPCPSLTVNPTIRADGQITGCAVVFGAECPPLSFGNLQSASLAESLDSMNTDPLASWIHKIGVVELKHLIEANTEIRFPEQYVNICHLCGDILSNPQALEFLNRLGLRREVIRTCIPDPSIYSGRGD